MSPRSAIFSAFRSFWKSSRKGTALAMSLSMTSAFLFMSAGAMTVVFESRKVSSQVERMNGAYFAAERGMEYSLFDISGHLPGYEVDEESTYGKFQSQQTESNTMIKIESTSYSASGTTITIPAVGKGDSEDSSDWNTIPSGASVKIPLFTDKTIPTPTATATPTSTPTT